MNSQKILKAEKFNIIEATSDMLDGWREVDRFMPICCRKIYL